MQIRALSLWQPWASLWASGEKRVETRSWECPRDIPLPTVFAVHATASVGFKMGDFVSLCVDNAFYRAAIERIGYKGDMTKAFPRGAVVGMVRLAACVSTAMMLSGFAFNGLLTQKESEFGDFTPGRYGWVADRFILFKEPVEQKGARGVWWWEVPAEHEPWVASAMDMLPFHQVTQQQERECNSTDGQGSDD